MTQTTRTDKEILNDYDLAIEAMSRQGISRREFCDLTLWAVKLINELVNANPVAFKEWEETGQQQPAFNLLPAEPIKRDVKCFNQIQPKIDPIEASLQKVAAGVF